VHFVLKMMKDGHFISRLKSGVFVLALIMIRENVSAIAKVYAFNRILRS